MKVTGSFTVDAPLVNFSGDLIPVVKNLSFNDGVESLTATNDVLWRANMTTDSSENPVTWEIRMHEQTPVNPVLDETVLNIDTGSDLGDRALIIGVIDCIDDYCWDAFTDAWNDIPGTWEVAAVPIPAALYLSCSGLLGLVGLSRRKKARTVKIDPNYPFASSLCKSNVSVPRILFCRLLFALH